MPVTVFTLTAMINAASGLQHIQIHDVGIDTIFFFSVKLNLIHQAVYY